jgi:hypothetical protein
MNEIIKKRIEKAAKEYSDFNDIDECFIEGANYALENLWIPVDEALPKENKLGDSYFVLVKTSIRYPFLACYSYKHETWKDINHVAIHGVTHWMPIPELKGGEK